MSNDFDPDKSLSQRYGNLSPRRFTEAMRLHESLRSLATGSKSAARDAIMERYSHILPGLAKLGLARPLLRGPAGPYTRWLRQRKRQRLINKNITFYFMPKKNFFPSLVIFFVSFIFPREVSYRGSRIFSPQPLLIRTGPSAYLCFILLYTCSHCCGRQLVSRLKGVVVFYI